MGILWEWMVHETFTCLGYCWETISYGYFIYQSMLLSQQFCNLVTTCHYRFRVNIMCAYKWDIYGVKEHSQVKRILAFAIEPLSSSFLIHYICSTHTIVWKLDDNRTKNRCFGCWNLVHHYVRYSNHNINIFSQKENWRVVPPFAANDVFRIMEITFIPWHFLIFFQFWHLLRFFHTVPAA